MAAAGLFDMSIYSTLWHLRFPRLGDAYFGCEWVDVFAQGVPAHIGTPTAGYGYESGDPFAAFLLHDRLCAELRGTRPGLVLQVFRPNATSALAFEDGPWQSLPSEPRGGRG